MSNCCHAENEQSVVDSRNVFSIKSLIDGKEMVSKLTKQILSITSGPIIRDNDNEYVVWQHRDKSVSYEEVLKNAEKSARSILGHKLASDKPTWEFSRLYYGSSKDIEEKIDGNQRGFLNDLVNWFIVEYKPIKNDKQQQKADILKIVVLLDGQVIPLKELVTSK